jgi:steroid 5-alpha reductase family enzyme
MDDGERRALISVPVVILVGAIVALGGSQGGHRLFGVPVFALCVGLAFLINWIAFIPAYLQQTETFYDLTGSLTYLTVVIIAVLSSPGVDARSLLLLALVAVWAIRLGSFLFRRVRADGFDRRFTKIKPSIPRFLLAWTLQGLWVSLSLAAALAAITSQNRVALGAFALVGLLVWVAGFAIEVVADQQKRQFRNQPENAGKFISTGLWAWSRHPNYFGEITLWVGVAIITLPVLQGWQWITMISPFFIILLITRISGVPMLEERADKKWGGQPEYEKYKAQTPVLVMRPPSGLN